MPSWLYQCNSPSINGLRTITVLLYNGPLLCGFNVPVKWLRDKLKGLERQVVFQSVVSAKALIVLILFLSLPLRLNSLCGWSRPSS